MNDITLALTNPDALTDSVMTAQSMPALTGNDLVDLHCGGCGELLAKGLNPQVIARSFSTERRLLLKCVCGAHNLIREAKGGSGTADQSAGGS